MLVPSFATRVCTSNWNAAVTEVSLWRVRLQVVAVPLQAPPHPMNRAEVDAAATSVALAPFASVALQAVAPSPQESVPVTFPGPVTVADRVTCGGGPASKWAKTWVSARMTTEHAPGPLQPAPHPMNFAVPVLVAVSATVLPSGKSALHGDCVQSMPAGLDTTRPWPSTTTTRRREPGGRVKAAVTGMSPLTVTWHAPGPLQAPGPPAEVAPGAGTAPSS